MTEAAAGQAKARARWRDAIWRDPELLPTDAVVGLAMESYAGRDTGLLWPSFGSLAAHLLMHPDTVRRCVGRLVATGWLQLVRLRTGRGTSNTYALAHGRVPLVERLRQHLDSAGEDEALAAAHPSARRAHYSALIAGWRTEKAGRVDPASDAESRAPGPGFPEKSRAQPSKKPGVRVGKAGSPDPRNLLLRTFSKEPPRTRSFDRGDGDDQPDLLNDSRPSAKASVTEPDFDAFWQAYPLKVAKGAARKAYAAARKTASAAELLAGARRYAASRAAEIAAGRSESRYTAHAATWLRAERWADQPPEGHGEEPQQARPVAADPAALAAAEAAAAEHDPEGRWTEPLRLWRSLRYWPKGCGPAPDQTDHQIPEALLVAADRVSVMEAPQQPRQGAPGRPAHSSREAFERLAEAAEREAQLLRRKPA